ncbi:hypothetical protein CDD81_4921 [Ophiocordyceps australis]|uniref:Integrase zinc-binding domain-containing protein n=1 Tax=Ophiocordyceps australis TaxID=1399860 RepID=A0A2C5YB36_9HYPO|nr:hypothetical protein CDD81_4921 [Ophiocordyceps australis]
MVGKRYFGRDSGVLNVSALDLSLTRASWRWNEECPMEPSDMFASVSAHVSSIQSSVTPLPLGPDTALDTFLKDPWYSDVVAFLTDGRLPDPLDRHRCKWITRESEKFVWKRNCLWHLSQTLWTRCLLQGEVSGALFEAHDMAGHFGIDSTRRRLNRFVWWPRMAADVVGSAYSAPL